jgi:hypothetical protein
VTTDQIPEGEPVMRSRLVGAELLNWSDLDPSDGCTATGGPVTAALLDAVLTDAATVLVAGPHSLELLEQVADRAGAVDVLVRSAPDAEEIAVRLADRPVRVFCGALNRFAPGHGEKSYDIVVALDGLPRLVGPEAPALTWVDALAALRDRLAPTGRLLLGAANPFGIERLLKPDLTATLPGNEAWPREVAGSVEAPAGLHAVRAAMDSVGLSPSTVYAVYPELTQAEVGLVDATGPLAGALVARAVAGRFTDPALTDPYRTAQDAVAAGLGNELAAGWFLVVGSGSLPAVLTAASAPDGPGELLEEALLATLRLDDHLALRRLITGYIGWLRDQDGATAALATPDNLLTDGTSYRVFDQTGPATAGSGDALVVGQLARFVRRSLEAGTRQPWTVGGTPRELTARLAAMAGITVGDELWLTVPDGDDPARPQGLAEALAIIARLSHELTEANARVNWFEEQVDKIRRSRQYRLGGVVIKPARVVYHRVRKKIR